MKELLLWFAGIAFIGWVIGRLDFDTKPPPDGEHWP